MAWVGVSDCILAHICTRIRGIHRTQRALERLGISNISPHYWGYRWEPARMSHPRRSNGRFVRLICNNCPNWTHDACALTVPVAFLAAYKQSNKILPIGCFILSDSVPTSWSASEVKMNSSSLASVPTRSCVWKSHAHTVPTHQKQAKTRGKNMTVRVPYMALQARSGPKNDPADWQIDWSALSCTTVSSFINYPITLEITVLCCIVRLFES